MRINVVKFVLLSWWLLYFEVKRRNFQIKNIINFMICGKLKLSRVYAAELNNVYSFEIPQKH